MENWRTFIELSIAGEYTIEFYLSLRRNTKVVYRFLSKIFNRVKKWQNSRIINTDKAAPYDQALSLLKEEGKCPAHLKLEHRQIKSY